MSTDIAILKRAIASAKESFTGIVQANAAPLNFKSEAIYAMQAIQASTKLQACKPASIRNAVINVASIGLSLNPALKLAYLVPRWDRNRGNQCNLDISYMGLCKLATDSHGIDYVMADLVYANDRFVITAKDERPIHEFSPFAPVESRGEIVGVYCCARLSTGGYLTGVMSKDEVEYIRQLYATPNSGAWIKHWGEQAKKTCIKRESKLWPRTSNEFKEAMATMDVDDIESYQHEEDPEAPEDNSGDNGRPVIDMYPQEEFEKNFPTWKAAIDAGRIDATAVIEKVSTKYSLSDEQEEAILSCKASEKAA